MNQTAPPNKTQNRTIEIPKTAQKPKGAKWGVPSCLIYGEAGLGKTTAARDLGRYTNSEPIFIITENSHDDIEHRGVIVETWSEFLQAVNAICSLPLNESRCVIIDTIDSMCDMAREHLLKTKNVETLNQIDFGEGHKTVKASVRKIIQRLMKDRVLIGISHLDIIEVNELKKYQKLRPTASGKTGEIFAKMAQNILCLQTRFIETKEGRMKSQNFMKNISVDLSKFDKQFPKCEASQRILVCQPTTNITAKIRSPLKQFPHFVFMNNPYDGNTMKNFHEIYQQIVVEGKDCKIKQAIFATETQAEEDEEEETPKKAVALKSTKPILRKRN